MFIIKETEENNKKTFEYNNYNNRYEFNQVKYYIKYIRKYKVFKRLFSQVSQDYKEYEKSILEDKSDYICECILKYINSLKKFEEKGKLKLKSMFRCDNELKEIINIAHSNKAYNLMYNMRNFDEHIDCPIETIICSLGEKPKIVIDIDNIKNQLKNTGWKQLLSEQFSENDKIQINSYIKKSYEVAKGIFKKFYEYILKEDIYLYKFCVRLYEFYEKYRVEDEAYNIYLTDESIIKNEKIKKVDVENLSRKIDLSNRIDIIFIKELIFSMRINVRNIEFDVGQTFIKDGISYQCISKKKNILDNKIIEQRMVPSCLTSKDVDFILKYV